MLYPAHVASSAAVGGLTTGLLGAGDSTLLYMVVAGVAGLVPDLDTPYSKLGRKIPLISYPLYFLLGHRTTTHSVLFAVILSTPLLLINFLFGLSFLMGILTHLLGDFFTAASYRSRLPLLYPLKRTYGYYLFKVGGIVEHLVITPLSLLLIVITITFL